VKKESTALSDDALTLLQAAYDSFRERAEWPRVDELQVGFDRAGVAIEVDALGQQLSPYAWLSRGSNETLELSICGVASCDRADSDLADVLTLGRLAHSRYLERGAGVSIDSTEVGPLVGDEVIRLRKVEQLCRGLPGFGGGSSNDEYWTIQITRAIRVWADVENIEQMLSLAPCSRSGEGRKLAIPAEQPATPATPERRDAVGLVGHGWFSMREKGAPAAIAEELSSAAWGGLIALVRSTEAANGFALAYPIECPDRREHVVDTDRETLGLAVGDHAEGLEWPLNPGEIPAAPVAMDLIEFLHSAVADAREESGRWHSYFNHYHLEFDQAGGQRQFRSKVNDLYRRHGLAFEVKPSGRVERLGSPVVQGLARQLPASGDASLDRRLEQALTLWVSPDPSDRLHAVRELWACFERLKTLEDPQHKKASVAAIIHLAVGETPLLGVVQEDATDLTKIGNQFDIRHFEIGKHELSDPLHLDYLYGRLYNLIWLLLKSRSKRGGGAAS
jgi:hypothetical protein